MKLLLWVKQKGLALKSQIITSPRIVNIVQCIKLVPIDNFEIFIIFLAIRVLLRINTKLDWDIKFKICQNSLYQSEMVLKSFKISLFIV